MDTILEEDCRPPRSCEMPDLSELYDKVLLTLILNVWLRGRGPKDQKASIFVTSFIRLVDKTLVEYKYSRSALLEYVNTPANTMSPLFRATAHLETCIHSLKRAIRFAEHIRRDKKSPTIPQKLDVISKSAQIRITVVRDAIEHMDDRIIKGKIPKNGPVALIMKSDCLELAGEIITYIELAEWIKQLHRLALEFADYQDQPVE